MKIFSPSSLLAALTLSLIFSLAACLSTGPRKTLRDMGEALRKKDSSAFLAGLDLKVFAANEIKNMTRDNQALNSINSLGRAMGLGGGMVDDLLGSVLNMESQLQQRFTRGVGTGEMENECRAAQTPDCPWTVEALKNARVKELSDVAAVAAVTTQARVTSWLALQKKGERWLVVGRALLEDVAKTYAGDRSAPPETGAPVETPGPDKKPKDGQPDGGVTKI